MQNSDPVQHRAYLALFIVQLLFGINYIASKLIVGVMPPLIWAAVRVVVSAVALYTMASLLQNKRPTLDRKFFFHIIPFACLGVIFNQGAFLTGLKYTTATNSAVLNTLIPVFTLFFVTLLGKEKASLRRIIGFFVAFSGVLVLRNVENFTLSDQTWIGDLLILFNCMSYGLFLTLSKRFMSENDPFWVTTWMFMIGSIGLTAMSIPSWGDFQMPHFTAPLVASMVFTVLGSTLLAYLLNNWALARVRSSSVALFIYIQPVLASIMAWFVLGEIPTVRTIGSSALIFLGMVLSLQLVPSPTKNQPH